MRRSEVAQANVNGAMVEHKAAERAHADAEKALTLTKSALEGAKQTLKTRKATLKSAKKKQKRVGEECAKIKLKILAVVDVCQVEVANGSFVKASEAFQEFHKLRWKYRVLECSCENMLSFSVLQDRLATAFEGVPVQHLMKDYS